MSELAAGSERIRNRAGTRVQWNRGGQKGKGLEFGQKSDVEFVFSIRSKARVKRFSSGQGDITCEAFDEPRKSSKAIDKRVIINSRDKNVVIARIATKIRFLF